MRDPPDRSPDGSADGRRGRPWRSPDPSRPVPKGRAPARANLLKFSPGAIHAPRRVHLRPAAVPELSAPGRPRPDGPRGPRPRVQRRPAGPPLRRGRTGGAAEAYDDLHRQRGGPGPRRAVRLRAPRQPDLRDAGALGRLTREADQRRPGETMSDPIWAAPRNGPGAGR